MKKLIPQTRRNKTTITIRSSGYAGMPREVESRGWTPGAKFDMFTDDYKLIFKLDPNGAWVLRGKGPEYTRKDGSEPPLLYTKRMADPGQYQFEIKDDMFIIDTEAEI